MTEEKICPIMTDGKWGYVKCQKDKCMAWEPEQTRCAHSNDCDSVDGTSCDVNTCPEFKAVVHSKGFCKLIERRE